jgi:hypothetical protein
LCDDLADFLTIAKIYSAFESNGMLGLFLSCSYLLRRVPFYGKIFYNEFRGQQVIDDLERITPAGKKTGCVCREKEGQHAARCLRRRGNFVHYMVKEGCDAKSLSQYRSYRLSFGGHHELREHWRKKNAERRTRHARTAEDGRSAGPEER